MRIQTVHVCNTCTCVKVYSMYAYNMRLHNCIYSPTCLVSTLKDTRNLYFHQRYLLSVLVDILSLHELGTE